MSSVSQYKVLITTSGIGSRLGNLTQFTNKCLIRVGEKPAISHIIDLYPSDIPIIVTLGYFGEHVRQFLEIAYPERSIEFVDVPNYNGPGSSLAHSMLAAKSNLQSPFIFHASDSLLLETQIAEPDCNWIGGAHQRDASNYATFDVAADRVTKFHPKGMVDFDLVHIGVVGIKDFKIFWETLRRCILEFPFDSSLNDVIVLKNMLHEIKIEYRVFENWLDIGNSFSLGNARAILDKGSSILEKESESVMFVNDKVIKFFADSNQCQARVKRELDLRGFVPIIDKATKNFFSYSYIRGDTLSNSKNPSDITQLLDFTHEFFWKIDTTGVNSSFKERAHAFYAEKTISRTSDYVKTRGFPDSHYKINGIQVPPLHEYLPEAFSYLQKDLRPSRFHGDFILDNIIKHDSSFTFIDWRQDFGGSLSLGDIYYDFAKLNHSFVVNHEIVNKGLFEVNRKSDEVTVGILRKDNLVEMQLLFNNWILSHGYDLKKISILTSVIWLNMSPIHHHPFNDFLFEFGKLQLWRALHV